MHLTKTLTRCLLIHCRDHIVSEGHHQRDWATGSHRFVVKTDCRIISHLTITATAASTYSMNTTTTIQLNCNNWYIYTHSLKSHTVSCISLLGHVGLHENDTPTLIVQSVFTRDCIYAMARICHANSVCPSHVCTVSKRLNISSKFFDYVTGPSF